MKDNSKQFQAIVLGAGANGLGAVRGLLKAGLDCYLIGLSEDDPSLLSTLPVAKVPLKGGSRAEKRVHMFDLLDEAPKDVVIIPTSDWFVSAMQEYRLLRPGRFRYAMTDKAITDMLIDKAVETKVISEVARVPATVQELPDSPEKLLEQLRLPIIFKPRSFEHYRLGKKNIQVRNSEELQQFYHHFSDVLESTIAQEIIPGDDSCLWVCNCTFNSSSELASVFVFRRLNLSPPHYGVTSYAVSESNDSIVEEVRKIGQHIGFSGPGMFEFKYDERDDDYKYIELNPRLGMCNYFDTSCGINNVANAYWVAIGEEGRIESRLQNDGVIFMSLFEDLYSRLKDGQSVARILRTYLRDFFHPHVFAYFSLKDPAPALVMLYRDCSLLLRSMRKKLVG